MINDECEENKSFLHAINFICTSHFCPKENNEIFYTHINKILTGNRNKYVKEYYLIMGVEARVSPENTYLSPTEFGLAVKS
jgi:hypothetical protein